MRVSCRWSRPRFSPTSAKQAKRYSAKDLKRFAEHKRYTLMLAFSPGDTQNGSWIIS